MEMKTIHIGDLGDIKTGSTPSKKNPDNYGEYALWIKPTDINPEEKYTRVVEEMFSEKAATDCRSRLIPAKSICVPCIGTVGTKLTMTPCDCFVNQSINAVIPNDDYDNDYVYYLLLNFLPNLKSINKGTASGREYIAKSAFENIEIKVHSDIRVQRIIGKILSAYDDMINNCKKQIALLEEAAQRLYREWFVDLRFHGHESTPIGDNGLPVGWRKEPIFPVCQTVLGGTPSRKNSDFWNGNIPWINSGAVNLDRITEGSEYITDIALKKSATKLMPKHTTLLAITGATLGQVSYTEIDVCGNQSIIGIIPPNPNLEEYIYLLTINEIETIISPAGGSAQQHINKDILNKYEISIPSDDVLTQFKERVNPYFNKISTCYQTLNDCTKLKSIMLPRLISGQIEINA